MNRKNFMEIFESEDELLAILNSKEQIVLDCSLGKIKFQEFIDKYDNFYMTFALDGHESDAEELELLNKYKSKIRLHREIWESVIAGGLCSDEDALKAEYFENGRFGSSEGVRRLKLIADKYLSN
jgi:hypothetical protein